MTIVFTDNEIKALQGNPEALRVLANWHSCQETMADAIGPEFAGCVQHHEARKRELRAVADRIEADY